MSAKDKARLIASLGVLAAVALASSAPGAAPAATTSPEPASGTPVAVYICNQKLTSAQPSFSRGGDVWSPASATAAAVGEKLITGGSAYRLGPASYAVAKLTQGGIDYISLNGLATAYGAHIAATAAQVKISARVTDVRFTGGVLRVRTNLPVRYSVRTLKSPDRVYIDILGARLEGSPAETRSPTAVVRALRLAQFDDNTVRVTAQLPGPVAHKVLSPARTQEISVQIGAPAPEPRANPEKAHSDGREPPAQPSPAPAPTISVAPAEIASVTATANAYAVRLTLDADAPLEPRFGMHIDSGDYWLRIPNARLRADAPELIVSGPILQSVEVRQEGTDAEPVVSIRASSDRVLISKISRGVTPGQMYWTLALPTLSDGNWRGKLVVVDAGHGGGDTGAQGNGLVEKSINLSIARLVRDEAIRRDLNVVMTREADKTLSLRARTDLISASDAHLFVSIHNNSSARRNSASGTEVYYHLADPESRALAEIVVEKITQASGFANRGARSDSKLYKTGLFVLRNSPTPAILIEVAYINSTSDAAKLKDTGVQAKVAKAIVDAIVAYLGKPLEAASSEAAQPKFWEGSVDEEAVADQTMYAGGTN